MAHLLYLSPRGACMGCFKIRREFISCLTYYLNQLYNPEIFEGTFFDSIDVFFSTLIKFVYCLINVGKPFLISNRLSHI